MSINAVGASGSAQFQAVQSQAGAARPAPPPRPPEGGGPVDGGRLIDAIASALKDIGATTASDDASADRASASDPAKALGDFLHSLADALHGQHGGGGPQGAGPGGPPPGQQGGPPPGQQGGPPPGQQGGARGGNLQSDLQSLIASLNSTRASSSDSSSTSSDSATTSNSTVATLSSSFKELISALGLNEASGTASKLTQFLQALSSNLQGANASGNLIDTSA
jgi:hypothetical protein